MQPLGSTTKTAKKPSCESCFFKQNLLCALDLDGPCPTYRPNSELGLVPPKQTQLPIAGQRQISDRWAFPTAAEQAARYNA